MGGVAALIGQLGMYPGHPMPRFGAVLRAFLFARQVPLCPRQLALGTTEKARVGDFVAVTGDDAVRQPQVDTDHLRCHGQRCGRFFHQKADVVTASGVTAYCDAARCAGKIPTPADIEWGFLLGEPQLAVAPAKAVGHVGGRLFALFFLEGGVSRLAFEEVGEGAVEMPERLLQADVGHLGQKGGVRLFFEGGERFGGGAVPHALLSLKPRIGALTQEMIVNVPHTAKRPGKLVSLLGRGIEPITVGTVYGRHG